MAGAVWTIRGVDEGVRKMAAKAAKARRLTLREWIEEAVRAHAPVAVEETEQPESAQLDLVTWINKVRELDSRVAQLEAGGAPVSALEGLPGSDTPRPTPKPVARERTGAARATSSEAEGVREMRRLGYSKAEIAQAFGKSGNWPDRYMRGLPIDCEAAARRMREAGMTLDEIRKTLAHRMRGTDQQIDEEAVRRGWRMAGSGRLD